MACDVLYYNMIKLQAEQKTHDGVDDTKWATEQAMFVSVHNVMLLDTLCEPHLSHQGCWIIILAGVGKGRVKIGA